MLRTEFTPRMLPVMLTCWRADVLTDVIFIALREMADPNLSGGCIDLQDTNPTSRMRLSYLVVKIIFWNYVIPDTAPGFLTERRGRVVGIRTSYTAVLGSKVGLETRFADWSFCGFPQSL
jgi:hypothetical protein